VPGVLAYGSSSADAMSKAEVLALRVIADRLRDGCAKTRVLAKVDKVGMKT